MATIAERVSRLEGGYGHLATKADVAEAKAEVKADVAEVKGELRALRWTTGIGIAAATLGLGVLQVILKFAA